MSNVVALADFRAPTPATHEGGPSLDTWKRLFTEARDLTQLARREAAIHRRYYDGDIDPKVLTELRRKKQPTFNINRIRPGVEGMVGVVEKGKSDPRAYPRTPQDEGSADVATDTLRYVADTNRWQQNKLKVFRNMCIEGTAAVIVEVDDQLDVKIRRWRYEEFFYDPYSREPDFSDASYMGGAKWQYVDEIVSSYPEYESQVRASCARGDVGDATWSDRPTFGSTTWSDPRRKRMLIVEMYKRDRGTWLKCCFVGDLKLEEGPSPYQDNDGKPCNPIEAHSVFVGDDNHRYGVVKDMLGPQDEINVYRRKGAHFAAFRQLQETDPLAAGIDPEEARKEAAKPDGVIPSGWNIVANTDKFQMDMALLAEAKAEIERTQVNPAILGRQGADQSGRAALIRQQAGLTEIAHLYAGLDDLEMRIYRQCWARIRQFWTQPKFIRVTDNPDAVKFLQINEPQWGPPEPVIDETTGQMQIDPATGQPVLAPKFLGLKNEVAKMGVDIIVDSTPDTANVQQEQYNALVELAKIPGALGPNPGMVLLKASSLPHKREIMDELESQQQAAQQAGPAQPPPAPPLTPEQQAAQQLGLRKTQAEIEKTTAQGHEANARAAKLASEAHHVDVTAAVLPSKAAIELANGANALDASRRQQMQDQWVEPRQPDF